VAVFGDTKGQLVDETFFQGGPFLSEYDRTKWLAHYKVAVPLIEKGSPIIIVMPGGVYGPGDTSVQADMMRLFYRGLPVLPAPNTTLTYAHVEDIAEGHILAAERGKIGESYVLAGPAISIGEMVEFWSHLTGKPAPKLQVPSGAIRPFAPLGGLINKLLPSSVFSEEGIRSLGATYMARSDKARAQLGWTSRPLQVGMKETFDWIIRTEGEQHTPDADHLPRQIAGVALLAAGVLLLVWLLGRRRR
jgi:nucleoside-diphosphate-sugar epimerase